MIQTATAPLMPWDDTLLDWEGDGEGRATDEHLAVEVGTAVIESGRAEFQLGPNGDGFSVGNSKCRVSLDAKVTLRVLHVAPGQAVVFAVYECVQQVGG
jgi:hypothetical protein